jgi:hypothetical protein
MSKEAMTFALEWAVDNSFALRKFSSPISVKLYFGDICMPLLARQRAHERLD